MSDLKPMTDAETAMTIAAMNDGISEAQAELVIGLLRHNGWLSPGDVPEIERERDDLTRRLVEVGQEWWLEQRENDEVAADKIARGGS